MLRVQQLMSHHVHCCRADDTLQSAARSMWDHDVGALPVVDDSGRAIAMVTDRDTCMAAYIRGQPLSQIRVAEVMSKSLFAASPTDSIDDALQVMKEHQVRRLPILDPEGRVIGLLSQNDLIQEADRERESADREISAVAVIAMLGAIGHSRFGRLTRGAA